MTQLVTAQAASSGRQSFSLEVRDKLGQSRKALYTSEAPGGLVNGLTSRRYPNGTCGPLTFQGKPSELDIEVGDVLYLSYDTGTRVVPVHFGTVVSAPVEDGPDWGTYESAGGKKLLERGVCEPHPVLDSLPFLTGDAGHFLRTLVQLYRHASLKYEFARIPDTGVTLSGVAAELTRLDKALEAVLESVPDIKENDWGADPDGFIVIRPAAGTVRLPYRQVRAQFRGNVTADEVVTKATIRVANQVSEGAIVSPGYRPRVIGYSYEDPEHRLWGAHSVFEIPKDDDGQPVIDVLKDTPTEGLSFTTGWTASLGTVQAVVRDGNITTYAQNPTATTEHFLNAVPSRFDRLVGAELVFEASAGSFGLSLLFTFFADSLIAHTALFSLQEYKGRGKVRVRFIAPVPTDPSVDEVQATLQVSGAQTAGDVKVYEFRGLEANTALLDQIARAQIRLPAKELAEVECAYGPEGENGFLLEAVGKTLVLENDDGTVARTGEIAEIVDTYNTEDGMRSRIALGEPIRSPEVKALQRFVRQATR